MKNYICPECGKEMERMPNVSVEYFPVYSPEQSFPISITLRYNELYVCCNAKISIDKYLKYIPLLEKKE